MEHRHGLSHGRPTTIFFGGLPHHTTEDDIVRHVQQFCAVLSVKLPIQKTSNKSAGYAFVEVADARIAQAIIRHAYVVNGRVVDCQAALERKDKYFYREDLLQRKLFIAGIKSHVDLGHIKEALQRFGPLKNYYRIKSSHINRGLAFAELFKARDAAAVVAEGLFVDGCQLRVSFFRPKDEKLVENTLNEIREPSQVQNDHLIWPMDAQMSNNRQAKNIKASPIKSEIDDSNRQVQVTCDDQGGLSVSDYDKNYQFRIIRRMRSFSKVSRATINGSVVFLRQPIAGKVLGGKLSGIKNLLRMTQKDSSAMEFKSDGNNHQARFGKAVRRKDAFEKQYPEPLSNLRGLHKETSAHYQNNQAAFDGLDF